MKDKMKNYLTLVKLEIKKVYRNRFVFIFLMILPIVTLFALSFIKIPPINIAILIDDDNVEENVIYQDIKHYFGNNVNYIIVDSEEVGQKQVENNDATLFIKITSQQDPVSIDCYYNPYSSISSSLIANLNVAKNEYTYNALIDFFNSHGVTLNESYFQVFNYYAVGETANSIQENYGNNSAQEYLVYRLEFVTMICLALLLGLAYSYTRDSEFNSGKTLNYMPIGINKYFTSKICFYVFVAIIHIVLCLLIGFWRFNLDNNINILIITLLSLPFILATLFVGLVIGQIKSQVGMIFAALIVVLFPIFVFVNINYVDIVLPLQIVLNMFPVTPYSNLLAGYFATQKISWQCIVISCGQAAVFYTLAYCLKRLSLKKKN